MENNLTKYILYITVNKVNNKIYIGTHSTDNPYVFDGYIGNGLNKFKPSTLNNPKTNFHYAVKKYGWDAFTRYTLGIYNTREDALLVERTLVNEEFINRSDTYNMAIGGERSFDNSKSINKFDFKGNLIESYKSLLEAAQANNLWAENIDIASRKKTSYGNCFWSEEDSIDVDEFNLIYQEKLIYVYDSQGKFIRTYESVAEAAKDYDICRESMRDKIYKLTKYQGCYFSYTSPDKFKTKYNLKTIIYQYDMSGNFIQEGTLEYFSSKYNISDIKLYKVANAKLSTLEFQWNLENPSKMNNKLSYENPGIPKKVGQYDLEGNLIKVYDTVTSCRKDFSNVSKVLKGILSKTKGFTFKYID